MIVFLLFLTMLTWCRGVSNCFLTELQIISYSNIFMKRIPNLKHKTVNNKKVIFDKIFIERGRWISKNHSLDMDIPTLIWIFIFWSRPSLIFELHTTCFHELPIPNPEFSRMFKPVNWVLVYICCCFVKNIQTGRKICGNW